jgi:thymidylate kinase
MRVSVSGTSNTGKSTLVKAFLKKWPMYKTTAKTYRDILTENNLEHSSKTTTETQLLILDWMTQTLEENKDEKYVVYDRCPLDNLAYSLHAAEKNLISEEVLGITVDVVRRSLKNLDIIFWLKYDPAIKIVNDGTRDTNLNYIREIDDIFAGLYEQYSDHLGNTPFFIAEDCPAIIPVDMTNLDDRIAWIGEFIDQKGNLIETGESVLDPKNLEMMEQMLKDQGLWIEKDAQYKNLTDQIKNFKI